MDFIFHRMHFSFAWHNEKKNESKQHPKNYLLKERTHNTFTSSLADWFFGSSQTMCFENNFRTQVNVPCKIDWMVPNFWKGCRFKLDGLEKRSNELLEALMLKYTYEKFIRHFKNAQNQFAFIREREVNCLSAHIKWIVFAKSKYEFMNRKILLSMRTSNGRRFNGRDVL